MLTRTQLFDAIKFFDYDGRLPLYYDDGSGEQEIVGFIPFKIDVDYVAKGVQKKRIILVKYAGV